MATKLKKKDVVVVGLGAAGGTMVQPLTEAGLEVVGLEAGPRYTTRDFPLDEIRNDIRSWMSSSKVLDEVPTWRPNPQASAEDPTQAGALVIHMVNGVGGSSIHWTSQAWRFTPWNFKTASETRKRYGAGKIPAGSTVADWPIGYEDLEPYYERVEYLHGISGVAGNLGGEKNPEGNVLEAPREKPYPLPPLRSTSWTEKIAEAAGSLGYDPFPGPAGARSAPYEGMSGCTYCGYCTYAGCYVDAKATPMLRGIPEAEESGNLEVVPEARVTEVLVDSDGRASGVRYVRGGEEFVQPAGFVIISTYTYENTRLLLTSTSRPFPKGLSNNSGQVGKNYMSHVFCGVNALFPGEKLNLFNGTGAQATCLDNLNGDNFDHADLPFIGGGIVSAGHEQKPIAAAMASSPSVPRWGSEWKSWIKENAGSVGGTLAQLESLSYEDQFLDLDPGKTDPLGIPVIRVTSDVHRAESERYDYMFAKQEELLKEAGAEETWPGFPKIPAATHSHAYGGTRMGDDPDSSVVDGNCISHEVPNLAVVGASTFPTTAGYNPTLTLMALAWRSADRIAKDFEGLAS